MLRMIVIMVGRFRLWVRVLTAISGFEGVVEFGEAEGE